MDDILAFAKNMIRTNPNISNSPWAEEAMNAILTGDSKKGSAIAENLCNSYGVSRDEATKMARNWYNGQR